MTKSSEERGVQGLVGGTVVTESDVIAGERCGRGVGETGERSHRESRVGRGAIRDERGCHGVDLVQAERDLWNVRLDLKI